MTIPLKKIFTDILLVSSAFVAVVWAFSGQYNALSCLLGASLVGFNLVVLYWAWHRIFSKKSIALAVGVIVSKYAILGLIVYYVVSKNLVDVLSFLIGCGSLLLVLILMSIQYKKVIEP